MDDDVLRELGGCHDPDLDPVFGFLAGMAPEEDAPVVAAPDTKVVPKLDHPTSCGSDASEEEAEDSPSADEAPQLRGADIPDGDTQFKFSKVVDKQQIPCDVFPLLDDPGDVQEVVRTDLPGCDAYVLDNVLSASECAALVRQSEAAGYSFWDRSSNPDVDFRTAFTIECHHDELAERIWQRAAPFAGDVTIGSEEEDPRHERDIMGEWTRSRQNSDLLFARYIEGGHFSPHTDGATIRSFNERTFFTCLLYLNEPKWGGETNIYSNDQFGKKLQPGPDSKLTGDPKLILAAVKPKPGRMLVFYHGLMHEGAPASDKYIIRTDFFYRRKNPFCTAPEDIAAFDMYQEAQLLAEKGACAEAATLFRKAFKSSPALAKVYGQ